MSVPTLRIARPTDQFERLLDFYERGLGLSVLSRFQNHDGFDGIILGQPDHPYHLEFTRTAGRTVGAAPTTEHLLVFYLPLEPEWESAVLRMRNAGFEPVEPTNPYWDRSGITFEDPDGYRIVLQRSSWPPEKLDR